MKLKIEIEIDFCRVSNKTYKEYSVKNAVKDFTDIYTKVKAMHERNLMTDTETLQYLNNQRKEINKQYKCFTGITIHNFEMED